MKLSKIQTNRFYINKYNYIIKNIKLISKLKTYEINSERISVKNPCDYDATSCTALIYVQYVTSLTKDYSCPHREHNWCKIQGSHNRDYKEYHLLGCGTV
jgi:hypothetical protein